MNKPVALITGATGGLGQELAAGFARDGHAVALHYHRNEAKASELAGKIKADGGDAVACRADIGDAAQVTTMFAQIAKEFGRLDVLVHAAGNIAQGVLPKLSHADFDSVLRVHLKGAFLCTQAALRPMRKTKGGSIVYVGSMLGSRGVAGEANYAAAKAGLIGLAKSAAKELGRSGICVNVVYPGYMLTQMGEDAGEEIKEQAKKENVLNRWTDPADTARMILQLVKSRWISGQVLNYDARVL